MQKAPTITPDEYIYLSEEEKKALIAQMEKHREEQILQAYRDKRIDDYDKDFLLDAIRNSQQKIYAICNFIEKVLNKEPIGIYSYDPHNDEIKKDNRGNPINYGEGIISPLLSFCMEFTDDKNNPVFAYISTPKSIERAIQKLSGKYDKICHQEEKKLTDWAWNNEDREAYAERLQDLSRPHEMLNDMYRVTLSSKYLPNVLEYMDKCQNIKSEIFFSNPKDTNNLFTEDLGSNKKNYFDGSMIIRIQQGDFRFELLFKIHTLHEMDSLTHTIYEQSRKKSTSPAEKEKCEQRIKQINDLGIHKYHMEVLDKVNRMEEAQKRSLKGNKGENQTFNRCKQFLKKAYHVTSPKSIKAKEEFASQNLLNKLCFLQIIDKAPKDINIFEEDNTPIIENAFNRLSPAEKNRYYQIEKMAIKYESTINKIIANKVRSSKILSGGNGR